MRTATTPTTLGHVDPSTEPDAEGGARWAYRPHLDGLRAVAVYLVVAFHSGADRVAGGFIGVDVFFVLSGYLVTGVLLRAADDRGRIGLLGFYSRRARRLLPASLVNLVVTAVVFSVVAAPAELPSASEAIRAAALYVSNWWFIAEDAQYFGSDLQASPVLHYWSLSVEEQFYLLWPLALTGLLAVARRAPGASRRVVQGTVAAGALASLALAVAVGSDDLSRAYYGTDTRAYQLLAGALLALAPGALARVGGRRRARTVLPAVAVAALVALLLASTSLVDLGPIARGILATAVSVALLVALEAGSGGPARWLLSRPSLVWLGRVSYGTYLWHWLVIIVLAREAELGPAATFAVTSVIATGIAALSYQLLETPIRRTPTLDRLRGPVVAVALAMSLVVGLLIVPRVLEPPATATTAAAVVDDVGTPVTVDWQSAVDDVYEPCGQGGDVVCPLHEGSGRRALVVGDSHAAMLAPMLVDLAARHDLDLSGVFLPFCPWTRDIEYALFRGDCWDHQEVLYEETIPSLDPDVVFLVQRSVGDANSPMPLADRQTGVHAGVSPEAVAALDAAVRRTVADLRDDDRDVVIVEPIALAPFNPLTCLSDAEALEECRFVASPSPLAEEAVLPEVADDDGVWSLDLDAAVCPFLPICDPVLRGEVVYHDGDHLTVAFARTLVDPVDATLRDHGALSP